VPANVLAILYSAAAAAPNALEQKKIEPTALDKLGAGVAFAMLIVGGAVLLGMAIWMIYKALTQPQSLQTSWNAAQEAQFESYAQVETRIHGKSWMYAFGGALVFAAVAFAVYFGVTPTPDKTGQSMDLSTFDKKNKAPAPGPTVTP
jgi:hypothetical protein